MWRLCGWLVFVSSGGDVVSTELALRVAGVYEVNPLQQERWVRITTHVAASAYVYWASEQLYPEHRTLAWVLRVSYIVFWSYLTVHNLRVARGPP